ncbi:MAG: hypothetical protein ACE5IP_08535 [Terriglobia bacterium]
MIHYSPFQLFHRRPSDVSQRSLNVVFSKASMRRRYEVWFLRLGLADGSGAWWFRYLLLNPGRRWGGGCPGNPRGQPVEVWATWFPRGSRPLSLIQGFSQNQLTRSATGAGPFYFQVRENRLDEDSCAGCLDVDGHEVRWNLRYRSTLAVTLSEVGWIGFARTPHSDAVFSGEITLDGRTFRGQRLGFGVQGHNCGYRHRRLWNWAHCAFLDAKGGGLSTFEALEYELPFGMRFRKALLWHRGALYTFRRLVGICRDRENLQWVFRCSNPAEGTALVAILDGRGPSLHRLPYLTTDCAESFPVANNSLARATLIFSRSGHPLEEIHTDGGAALEMVGS